MHNIYHIINITKYANYLLVKLRNKSEVLNCKVLTQKTVIEYLSSNDLYLYIAVALNEDKVLSRPEDGILLISEQALVASDEDINEHCCLRIITVEHLIDLKEGEDVDVIVTFDPLTSPYYQAVPGFGLDSIKVKDNVIYFRVDPDQVPALDLSWMVAIARIFRCSLADFCFGNSRDREVLAGRAFNDYLNGEEHREMDTTGYLDRYIHYWKHNDVDYAPNSEGIEYINKVVDLESNRLPTFPVGKRKGRSSTGHRTLLKTKQRYHKNIYAYNLVDYLIESMQGTYNNDRSSMATILYEARTNTDLIRPELATLISNLPGRLTDDTAGNSDNTREGHDNPVVMQHNNMIWVRKKFGWTEPLDIGYHWSNSRGSIAWIDKDLLCNTIVYGTIETSSIDKYIKSPAIPERNRYIEPEWM